MADGTNSDNRGLPAVSAIVEVYRLFSKWTNETAIANDELNLFVQLQLNDSAYQLYVGGTVVSIIFLALKFLLHFAVPNGLRRLHDKLAHHLSWTLLMSQIVLLISIVVTSRQSLSGEKILFGLSVVLHFSVLSLFFFVNAMVFYLFRSSTPADEGQSSQQKYCLYAYGIPACIVLGAFILEWTLPALSTFRPNYTSPLFCWLCNFQGRMIFLLVPLGVLLAANILLFLLTALKSTFRPCCSRRNSLPQPKTYDDYMNQTTRGGEHDGCCCRFMQYFLLNALVGVTWIFRLLEIYEYRLPLFFMLNILQGPFVFFAFTPFRKLCCRPTPEDDSVALIRKTTMA